MNLFPEPSRSMTDQEGEIYFNTMVSQIKNFAPDEIVAVNRSGFSYAMWTAQILNLPLGVYWPNKAQLVVNEESKRLVFVDDNILQGTTYRQTKQFMLTKHYEWRWAVLFSDWFTPEQIRNEIIQGIRLPYFAVDPFWGSKKISKNYGIRYRDEKDSL